jgi:hypothetical protein
MTGTMDCLPRNRSYLESAVQISPKEKATAFHVTGSDT